MASAKEVAEEAERGQNPCQEEDAAGSATAQATVEIFNIASPATIEDAEAPRRSPEREIRIMKPPMINWD